MQAYAYIDITTPPKALIKDFCFTNLSAFDAILATVTKELRVKGISLLQLSCNVKNVHLRMSLLKLLTAGFIPVNIGGGLVIRPLEYKDLNVLYDIKNWYLTPMWTDLYSGSLR